MASSSSPSLLPLLLLFLAVAVETRPSPRRDDKQPLDSLFGSRLASLISASADDDVTEGSAGQAPPPSPSPPGGQRLADRRDVVPRFFLDFLRRQSKMRRRSRKSMVGGGRGGRGCFGMKMDRIGSVSGLGC